MERVRVTTGIIGMFSVTSILLVAQFIAMNNFVPVA
jgi:hypothetical protein